MSEQLSIRIDDDLKALIEEKRDSLPYDVPKSEIVRAALREHLSGNAGAGSLTPQTTSD